MKPDRKQTNTFVCELNKQKMASLKVEKPVGTQPSAGQAKKEPAPKASSTTPRAPASKPAPKKAEPKPREPKKKVSKQAYIPHHAIEL